MLEDLPSFGECGRVRELLKLLRELLKLYQLACVIEETCEIVSARLTEETCELVSVNQHD